MYIYFYIHTLCMHTHKYVVTRFNSHINRTKAPWLEAWIIPQSRALLRRAPLALSLGQAMEEAPPEARPLVSLWGLGDFARKSMGKSGFSHPTLMI